MSVQLQQQPLNRLVGATVLVDVRSNLKPHTSQGQLDFYLTKVVF